MNGSLAIYFGLNERPLGSKLIRGELGIETYVRDRAENCKKRILNWEHKRDESESALYKEHCNKMIKLYAQRLERAEYWMKRGYGL